MNKCKWCPSQSVITGTTTLAHYDDCPEQRIAALEAKLKEVITWVPVSEFETLKAERDLLKPIMKDLAAMLPRMPVVLFHYNPAVPWKALATRAVKALVDQEPEGSGDHN